MRISLLAPWIWTLIMFTPSSYAQTEAWLNPEVNAQNREPMRASFFPFPDAISARKEMEKAENFESLNGLWKFRWVPTPAEIPQGFEQLIHEDFHWDNLLLPSNWEFKNYGQARFTDTTYGFQTLDGEGRFSPAEAGKLPVENPVGLYRRTIELKPGWSRRKVFLHLNVVSSAITVYCNGRKVGYSEDSRLPAEFDLSSYLTEGKNVLAFRVQRYSDGSFLEAWPGWQLGGFLGDAYLFATPKTWLRDFTLRTDFNPTTLSARFDLDLVLHSFEGKPGSQTLSCKIFNPSGKEVWKKELQCNSLPNQDLSLKGQFLGNLEKVEAWSPEKPQLYTLEIQLQEPGTGSTRQCIVHGFGFHQNAFEKGNWTWNGKPVHIRGVHWKAHDPEDASLVSPALMEKEVKAMKELNLNALFPDGPAPDALYEICNRYGMWILDAANTSPTPRFLQGPAAISELPLWKKAWLERTQRLFERDKNQTCVLAWVPAKMGDAGSNPVSAAEILRSLDSRPILMSPEFKFLSSTDFLVEAQKKELKKEPKSPVLFTQIPTSARKIASLRTHWDSISTQSQILGGVIAQWKDLGIHRYQNGNLVLEYGKSYGSAFQEKGMGLVDEMLRPFPQAELIRFLFSPARIQPHLTGKMLAITVQNTFHQTSLPKSTLKVWGLESGKSTSKVFSVPALKPGETHIMQWNLPESKTPASGSPLHLEWMRKAEGDKPEIIWNRVHLDW